MAAPFKTVEFDMINSEPGVISLAGEIVDIGASYSVITKTGNTYTLNSVKEGAVKLGVGRENAKKFLYERKDLIEEAQSLILAEFKKKLKEGLMDVSKVSEPDDEEFDDVEEENKVSEE